MENFNEIFNKIVSEPDNIIKTIPIDEQAAKKAILNILGSLVPDYVVDDNNKDTLHKLFLYFTGHDKCNELGINLNKGVYLCGGVGTGKSIIMKAFKAFTGYLKQNSFQYYTATDIIDNVNISGVEFLGLFNHNYTGSKANPVTCYIDDIASKNEKVKNYGTEINVIEQLISIRYNVFERYRKLTHFSTNIPPAALKNLYDQRITDRLSEMCNIITIAGESRRK